MKKVIGKIQLFLATGHCCH